jgi:RNA polymerase sigma factor (sigma-70 family)
MLEFRRLNALGHKENMTSQSSITQWLDQVKDGDGHAVQKIWERYFSRLVRMARKKLKDAPRRVADEEDVVIMAFDSFFRGAEAGRFPKLEDRDDLWQVLVMITARKAINQVQHDRRQKRGGGQVRGESVFLADLSDEERAGIDQVVGSDPSPEFASQVTDQCEELLKQLGDDTLERIALAKFEGYTNDEIAAQLDVRTRTIERKLRTIREIWSVEN